jgi:hypothetical protein
VVLASDYTGPGSGLDSSTSELGGDTAGQVTADAAAASSDGATPPPSPVITAGSDDPKCVN